MNRSKLSAVELSSCRASESQSTFWLDSSLARQLDSPSKQGRRGSNSQPPVLETGALPIELRPCRSGSSLDAKANRQPDGRFRLAVSLLSLFTYSTIFVTTPEPTVLPPSRMANRTPSSMAIGFISSTLSRALSPGMHISASPTRLAVPVTSVVRK